LGDVTKENVWRINKYVENYWAPRLQEVWVNLVSPEQCNVKKFVRNKNISQGLRRIMQDSKLGK
jgi:hypothetical protein